MGRNIRLTREKQITLVDGKTGGNEEFVVMGRSAIGDDKFVLVIKARRPSTGQAMKVSLKDARDNNTGGITYLRFCYNRNTVADDGI